MVEFVLLTLALLGIVGAVVALFAAGIRSDTMRSDEELLWKDFDPPKNDDKAE